MYKSVNVSMSVCIIYVCIHVHMYEGKNPYVCVYLGKYYKSIYVYVYLGMDVG